VLTARLRAAARRGWSFGPAQRLRRPADRRGLFGQLV